MMNKTMWARPNAKIEEFAANEYVAACTDSTKWAVVCDIDTANQYEKDNGYYDDGAVSHGTDGCGNSSNQWITVVDGKATMVEKGETTYNCYFYTDNTYDSTKRVELSTFKPYSTIYWTTGEDNEGTASGRVWHHVGTVYGHGDFS